MNQVAVHEEDLVSLVGRAEAGLRFPELEFADPWAEEILAQLDLGPRDFDEGRLRAATLRTRAVDGIVRDFFDRNPDGLAVALYPGLCTRFSRVDNGALRWIDLDPPAVAKFKCGLLRTPDRHTVAACCSLTCTGWMSLLGAARDMPVLIVAEGTFHRRPIAELDAFLTCGVRRFSRLTELVVDYDARCPLRPSSLDASRACLELPSPDGAVARFPSVKLVTTADYPRPLARELEGINGVSRFLRGRGVPSIAHVRFT